MSFPKKRAFAEMSDSTEEAADETTSDERANVTFLEFDESSETLGTEDDERSENSLFESAFTGSDEGKRSSAK
jgi:hypothetical protein